MEELFVETNVESLEGNKAKVTVTIDAADVDGRITKTYKDFARKYNFPGFRRGKAPRPVIDNALGAEAVRATVTDELLNSAWAAAVDAEGLSPVSGPAMEETELVEAGKPYVFSFTIDLRPEVELSSYDAVEIELPFAEATEAEIDDQVSAMAEHYTTFEDASAATKLKPENYADLAIKATDAVTETVTVDPTKSEALTFESGKLADVGQVLGTNTILHNEANGSTGTSFSVDLHNFKFQGGKLFLSGASCFRRKRKAFKAFGIFVLVCLVRRNDDNLCIVAVSIGTFHGACHFIGECHAVPYAVDGLPVQLHDFSVPVNLHEFSFNAKALGKGFCHVCVKAHPLAGIILEVHRLKVGDAYDKSAFLLNVVHVAAAVCRAGTGIFAAACSH